jgi:hypothetical protein
MEKFEKEGRKFWERFGANLEQPPRLFFDFVNPEAYRKLLESRDLRGKFLMLEKNFGRIRVCGKVPLLLNEVKTRSLA